MLFDTQNHARRFLIEQLAVADVFSESRFLVVGLELMVQARSRQGKNRSFSVKLHGGGILLRIAIGRKQNGKLLSDMSA